MTTASIAETPIEDVSICTVCGTETDNVYSVREWIEYEREVNGSDFTEKETDTLTKYGPSGDLCQTCWKRVLNRMLNR